MVSNLVAEARLAEALLCLLRSDIVHCLSAAHAFQHAKGLGCDGLVKKRLALTSFDVFKRGKAKTTLA